MNALRSIADFEPGIHPDVPAVVYHQRVLGVVNSGALKLLAAKTPAHYRAWVDEPVDESESDTAAKAFGKALHCAVLEPEVFERTYIIAREHPYARVSDRLRNAKKPSQGTLDAIAYWDAWEAEMAGRIEVSHKDAIRLRGMAEAVRAHPIAGLFFQGGVSESTVIWTDPRTGLLCKARDDYWREDLWMIGDLKSTEDASPRAFARSVVNYGYHLQHAHYTSGRQVLFGREAPRFLFVGVEKEPPYSVGVYMLDADAEARGHELRDRAMDTLDRCLRSDEWPGLPPVVNTLSLPAWAFND